MLTVSPQAFGFVSCLICITVLSVVFAISSIVMHKLLQRMTQLRDNLVDMCRNPVYNNVHLGCDCRFHCHQCTCDGPQMLTFRWVGNVGSQSSNRFESKGTCGMEGILTSGSDSNEVGWYYNLYKCLALITEQNFQCLYTSCSQPFNHNSSNGPFDSPSQKKFTGSRYQKWRQMV